MNAIDLDVLGITCGVCVQRIKAALAPMEGVHGVEVDFRSGRVRVTATPDVAPSQLIAALSARRYDCTVAHHSTAPSPDLHEICLQPH